jgi:hypothetical protein
MVSLNPIKLATLLISAVVPSVYVAVAVNCRFVCIVTLGAGSGDTVMETIVFADVVVAVFEEHAAMLRIKDAISPMARQ